MHFVPENWNWLWCLLRALLWLLFMQCLLSQFCALSLSVYLVVPQGCSSSSVFPSVTWCTDCLSSVRSLQEHAGGCFCVLPAFLGSTWLLCYLHAVAALSVHAPRALASGWVSCVRPCVPAAVCYLCLAYRQPVLLPPPCYLLLYVLTFSHAPIYVVLIWVLLEYSHVLSICFGLCSAAWVMRCTYYAACVLPVGDAYGCRHVYYWYDCLLYAASRPV